MPGASGSPATKMRTSADSSQPAIASLESCYLTSTAHGTAGTEAQRLGLLACLATSKFRRTRGMGVVTARFLLHPSTKVRTSAYSTQPEGNKLERCCSTSSAHGTARTETQRLGLLASLATSNFTRTFVGSYQAPPAALLPKCERLQIACRKK